jgi:hypothetical protein
LISYINAIQDDRRNVSPVISLRFSVETNGDILPHPDNNMYVGCISIKPSCSRTLS